MKRSIAIFEIFMLICVIFSFAYLIEGTNGNYPGIQIESEFIRMSRSIMLSWLSRGIVSDQEEGLWTCPENLNGTICQEYAWNLCEESCAVGCFPGNIEDFTNCQPGMCYDSQHGNCLDNTPKLECENWGGSWYEIDDFEGQSLCAQNCCLGNAAEVDGEWEGDSAQYITSGECNYFSSTNGIPAEWIQVSGEIECLSMANSQVHGACLLEEIEGEYGNDGELKKNCKFTTKSECLSMGGEIHEGLLCTNNDLNTICEKTEQTECESGGDKVYYKDSCGNFANVYDSTKINNLDYWSRMFNYDELCEFGSSANPFSNQASCGTCDYLLGSKCGTPQDGDADPIYGENVCRDLGCVDEWGDYREQGESWCAFDSKIGVVNDGIINKERSIDLPGSRHYRRVCFDGEVRTEPCADMRNEVCIENHNEEIDFSSAACRINSWQLCYDANSDDSKLKNCEQNTDCTLKKISIGEDYKFDTCTPKYPPGFNFHPNDGGEGSARLCSSAGGLDKPFNCKRLEVKKFSGWKCERNCDCTSPEFTEAMNNLCLSMGDCGGNINIEGDYVKGYSIKRGVNVRQDYINSLNNYINPTEGQSVDALSSDEISKLYPHLAGLNEEELNSEILDTLGMVSGGMGMGMIALARSFPGIINSFGIGPSAGALEVATAAETSAPVLSATASGVAGALVGAAVVSMLLKYSGVSNGLPDIVTWGIIAGGAFSGAIIGINVLGGGVSSTMLAWGAWVGVAVIAIIVIAWAMGIGKTRTIDVEFSCVPWQPPTGGNKCDKCNPENEFDLPCSKYKCESLGQTCDFINEGTSEEICYDVSPNDATAPVISPWPEEIGEGFGYEETANGMKIKMDNSEDGCIQEYTPVNFGILTSEPAQCKISYEMTNSYEEMNEFFGDKSTYIPGHSDIDAMPTLNSLGVSGSEPDRRGDFNIYVRCQDGNGNSNVNEYVLNFCVSPANDVTAATINSFVPNPGYVGFGIENKSLEFYTNEPAECRWDLEDRPYEDMEPNSMCNWQPDQVTQNGWACSTNLNISESEEEIINYYFRCADQPWLDWDSEYENSELERNVNQEGIIYPLIRTTESLNISYVFPQNDEIILAGDFPVSVEIEIKTVGGIDGNAACEYSFGEDNFIGFFNTGETEHTQTFSSLYESGEYNLNFRCSDLAGNVATENTSFVIEVDEESPIITRVYDGGTLTVITNEPAECAYSNNECSFNFANETIMSGMELVHTTSFEFGLEYYIKCQDLYGNLGSCLEITGGY